MHSHSSSLVGRAFRAMIAEPWDFVSDAGDNVLEGQVIESSTSSDPFEWIKCKITPFRVGSKNVHEVAIVRRYEDKDSIASQLAKGADVGANILYDARKGVITTEQLREALKKNTRLSFLAGSVKLW